MWGEGSCACFHVCACMHRSASSVFLNPSLPYFGIRSSHWTPSSLISHTGYLAFPRNPSISASSALGLEVQTAIPSFLCEWVLGELNSGLCVFPAVTLADSLFPSPDVVICYSNISLCCGDWCLLQANRQTFRAMNSSWWFKSVTIKRMFILTTVFWALEAISSAHISSYHSL